VARRKHKTGRISVFKGRQAKLNKTIFHILALKGSLTIYDIHKEVRKQKQLTNTKYAVVNRRVRELEKSRYLEILGLKKTRAGFMVALYQLTTRGYLALLLETVNLNLFLKNANEVSIITALGIFTPDVWSQVYG